MLAVRAARDSLCLDALLSSSRSRTILTRSSVEQNRSSEADVEINETEVGRESQLWCNTFTPYVPSEGQLPTPQIW